MAKKKQSFLGAVVYTVVAVIMSYIVANKIGLYVASYAKNYKPSVSSVTKTTPTR